MCVAKVERNFKVDASRLGKYGLGEFYYAKIKLDFSDSQSIKLYFGRTTPDSFGQYVKIEKTPNFMNLYHSNRKRFSCSSLSFEFCSSSSHRLKSEIMIRYIL